MLLDSFALFSSNLHSFFLLKKNFLCMIEVTNSKKAIMKLFLLLVLTAVPTLTAAQLTDH